MNIRFSAAAAALIVLSASPALAEMRTLDVTGFHGVEVSSGIRATVSGGKAFSVVAESNNSRDLDDLRYEVRDGILHLWYDWGLGNIFDWSGRNISVTIGTEVLDKVTSTSGASVTAAGMMGEDIDLAATSGASLKAEAIEGMFYDMESTSGARLEASGLCSTADVEVTTGASLAAKDLDCGEVELEVTTGASLEITATKSVDAEVTTGAHATVHGKPTVKQLDTSTGGSADLPG